MTNNGRCRRRGVGTDNEIAVERRHYEEALKFYYVKNDYTEKTYYGKQIDYVLLEFNIRKGSFLYDDLWSSFVIDKTAQYFSKHEEAKFDSVDNYIMKSIKRNLRTRLIRSRNFYKRFDGSIILEEIIDKNYHLPEVTIHPLESTSIGGVDPTSEGLRPRTYVGSCADIFFVIKKFLGPVQDKVFELFFLDHLTDAQITTKISLSVKQLKSIRQQIRRIVQKNRYDILTELGLTDDDFM